MTIVHDATVPRYSENATCPDAATRPSEPATAAAATRRSSKVPAFASKMSAASRGVAFAGRPRNSRSAPFEARLTTTFVPSS